MLDKCANPTCSAVFRRLSDGGRLFAMKVDGTHPDNGDGRTRYRYFWLCSSCGGSLTIAVDAAKRVKVIPLPCTATVLRTAS